ncbi:caldesmon putative [Entamoeba histolytica]|uniref:Caldesmon, putative n=3 Tax=Entamoeba histolytica TaxID=5759 RepID=B1N4N4_ENTH1|nr:caldesmon, putative [Entamoeba histolytica HM-1:IMSS]EDS89077.1 caldesmon, putative [Entamoeba histolytica HM-1:IMSS]GAT98630.1 caldesmon putative [Entamoeba histolytica]|eukprot:XP_001914150.1 caldesmon, putative [Entamoeba histolytica HM-1:IMSS]
MSTTQHNYNLSARSFTRSKNQSGKPNSSNLKMDAKPFCKSKQKQKKAQQVEEFDEEPQPISPKQEVDELIPEEKKEIIISEQKPTEEEKTKKKQSKKEQKREMMKKKVQETQEEDEEIAVETPKEDEWIDAVKKDKKGESKKQRKKKEEEEKKKRKEEEERKRKEEEERIKKEEEEKARKEEEERIKREEEERKRQEEEERIKREEEEKARKEEEEEKARKEEEERKRKEEEIKNIFTRTLKESKNEGGKRYNLSEMESYRKCAVKLPEDVRNRFNLIYHETVERIEFSKSRNEPKPITLFSSMLDESQKKLSKMLVILNQLSQETNLEEAAKSLIYYLRSEEDIKIFITQFVKRCVNENKFCKLYVRFIQTLRQQVGLTQNVAQGATILSSALLEKAYDYFHKLPEPKVIREGMSQQEIEELKEEESIEQVEYRGTVNLIANLFELGLVNERLPLTCLQELSKDVNDMKIDAYITLCSKVGEKMMNSDNTSPIYGEIIEVFNKAKELEKNKKLSKRIRLLLMNIIQMMESGWTISPFGSMPPTPLPQTPSLQTPGLVASTTPVVSSHTPVASTYTPTNSKQSSSKYRPNRSTEKISRPKATKIFSMK